MELVSGKRDLNSDASAASLTIVVDRSLSIVYTTPASFKVR
jgi:hypothetical protein